MLRKALMGAAAAGAATLIAAGAASPAMAGPSSDYNQNDFGGVNVLSDFCINVSDVNVIQLIDLLTSGNASCDIDDSNMWVNGGKHH